MNFNNIMKSNDFNNANARNKTTSMTNETNVDHINVVLQEGC